MNHIRNKKGQLGGLQVGILTIAGIGIMLAIVLYILTQIGTSLTTTGLGTIINETSSANSTGDTFSHAGDLGFSLVNVTSFTNGTGTGVSVPFANYTNNGTALFNNTALAYNSGNVSYTYTFTASTVSSNATNTIISQFVAFLPWLGIILLVLAAGVVLFFVIRAFGGTGRGP